MARARAALPLAVAAALASVAPAHAAPAARSGIFGERYCEIIVLRGTPPAAEATVWNTIGLSRCPASWWSGLDANALKAREQATAVLLNGPRFWVIDRASTPKPGPVRSFSGQRLRDVATIRFTEASQLAQRPYVPRTIDRDNTWSWRKGRTVYELLAPRGVVYRMQAYSQIVDRTLGLSDLRRLGARLRLPSGWRYRVGRLGRADDLRARGRATIIQDELQNTYQRLP